MNESQIVNEPQICKDHKISIETQITNKHLILKEPQIINESQNLKDLQISKRTQFTNGP